MSNHGRVLLFLADDPGMRLHDIAARLRRRDSYQIVAHQPLPEPIAREKTFREVLALLLGAPTGQPPAERGRR